MNFTNIVTPSSSALRRSIKHGVLFLSLVWLTGCGVFYGKQGVFRGRAQDYLQAGSIKEVTLPEGVKTTGLQAMYYVPSVDATDEFGDPLVVEEYKVPRPQALGDKGEVGVKIQKLGDTSWVYLNASTGQVWPRTQNFLTQYGITVDRSDASNGIIESRWLKFRDDENNFLRFRIRLEKGIYADTTEVHILHQQAPEQTPTSELADKSWPKSSDSAEREEWLLRELANTLADTVDNTAASLLGQNVGGELKAGFTAYNGEPALHVHLNFDRAWATVLHSASKDGFVAWGDSPEQRIIHTAYASEDGGGLFSWGGDKKLPEKAPYALDELLANLASSEEAEALFGSTSGVSFSNKKLENAVGYLIFMVAQGEDEFVFVIRDWRGNKIPRNQAKALLRHLRANLI